VSDTSGVNVRLRDGLGMVSVGTPRGGAAALVRAVREQGGLALPEPGCWVGDDAVALLWCAPGQFLAVGDAVAVQRVAEALREVALTIDLTGARVVVRVSGREVREVLGRVVPLDLHPRAMGPGRVAATLAAHIGVQIWQVDDAPSYDIAGPVSFASGLMRALELAGAGVGGGSLAAR
jgi:heterotetrameric sarcosine oxidase gamma subunit